MCQLYIIGFKVSIERCRVAYSCLGPRKLFRSPWLVPVIAAMSRPSRNWRCLGSLVDCLGVAYSGLAREGERSAVMRPAMIVKESFMMGFRRSV
jgi:hypothetical protein